jgi:hypothetical protein
VKQALSQPERKVELSAIQGNNLAFIYPRRKMQLSAIQGKEKAVSWSCRNVLAASYIRNVRRLPIEQERSVCQQSREKGQYDSYHSMKALLSAILEEKVRKERPAISNLGKKGKYRGRKVHIQGERSSYQLSSVSHQLSTEKDRKREKRGER